MMNENYQNLEEWAKEPLKRLLEIYEKNEFSKETFEKILELRDKQIELKLKASQPKGQKFSTQVDNLIKQGVNPLIMLFRLMGHILDDEFFKQWVVESQFLEAKPNGVEDFYQSLIKLKKHLKGKALLDDFYQWKETEESKKEITVGEGKPVSEVIQPNSEKNNFSEEYYDEPDLDEIPY